MSRLDILDASFHYASKSAPRDQYVLLTFDAGDLSSPTLDEITDFIDARARSIPDLNKRLVEIPGNLEYPYWSRSVGLPPIVEFGSGTWESVVDELGLLVQKSVDATRAAWQVHVARDVEDVPHAVGRALVVVVQVSHALTDGRGATRLARALFSVDPPEPSQSQARLFKPHLRVPVAVGALAALPFRLAAARLAARRTRRTFERERGSITDRNVLRPSISSNVEPTGNRVAHVIPCAPHRLTKTRFSVTTTALTAVGLAAERYLETVGDAVPVTLNALVPMGLPEDVKWPAENRIVNGDVDLHVDVSDIAERARRTAASLAEAREKLLDPLLLRWIRAENLVPAPVFLALDRRARKHALRERTVHDEVTSNLTVVSVNRGDARLELCGAPGLFSGGFPMLGPARSLTHGFYGLGDTVTVCVTACPDTFPDHARYVDILKQAINDVVAVTTDET
ncbi:wax ester/triacylglycerol synthase domain-containing protein [Rhodococcoides fascians]|uniref:wax ester/triacylglycerol synthase domain-containing protein n=1 Tax=Rhodococcoides fascians TaxID=1828 RepID=UPI00056D7FA6|nr:MULTISPECIES: wax ester/triacylglycerol synthase domain-containing protein [Rhodococcus]OZE99880.1 hypothetical protein CH301_13365 [Rhodococcus sp. 15-1189-1-1a]OZF12458.1 hypothetical protein CH299_16370 [Rhodococcus sp. 14-2686-1-2]